MGAYAQIPIEGVSSYIKGYWGEWQTAYPPISANGRYDNLVLYPKGNHPSDFCVHLIIDDFKSQIDKKEKKRRIKANESYQYNGTIEISFPAIIRIKPYKGNPELYMVFFENMGIAFTF